MTTQHFLGSFGLPHPRLCTDLFGEKIGFVWTTPYPLIRLSTCADRLARSGISLLGPQSQVSASIAIPWNGAPSRCGQATRNAAERELSAANGRSHFSPVLQGWVGSSTTESALKVRESSITKNPHTFTLSCKIRPMPQSLAKVVVHLVFSTKHRVPAITPEIRTRIYPHLGNILKVDGCIPIQIGGFTDHVHLLFNQSRTVSIGRLVNDLKGKTSSTLNDALGGDFHWQDGYGIFSVGIHEVNQKVRYIQNQEEHHKTVSFQDEMRALYDEAGIEYDERWLWE